MTEIMNFPSSRSSSLPPSLPLSPTGHVIARRNAVQEHPRTLTPPPSLSPFHPLFLAYTRASPTYTRKCRALARQLGTALEAIYIPASLLSLSRGCTDGGVGGLVEISRVNERGGRRGRPGWPETTLEHCNSSNVSFMQNTC